ncbi:MAG: hypothetical protein CVU56_22070 [Deltaproteobacteria bacterium HGW-Deltaproteobacteria-14]|nr:MAG: hypothetical protein CVU56_22070 [Deltaproteobacteria bacterium HGW-Deltaproteobacteria-14]
MQAQEALALTEQLFVALDAEARPVGRLLRGLGVAQLLVVADLALVGLEQLPHLRHLPVPDPRLDGLLPVHPVDGLRGHLREQRREAVAEGVEGLTRLAVARQRRARGDAQPLRVEQPPHEDVAGALAVRRARQP